jgi:hypothetical protein
VYKPRLGLPQTPVSPVAPATTYSNGPRATDAVLGGARAEMRWRLHEPSGKVPRLVVQANINPRDFFSLPLPTAGRWTAPLAAFNEADTPRHWVASPDSGRTSLHWTLDDLCGQPVRRGQQPACLGLGTGLARFTAGGLQPPPANWRPPAGAPRRVPTGTSLRAGFYARMANSGPSSQNPN